MRMGSGSVGLRSGRGLEGVGVDVRGLVVLYVTVGVVSWDGAGREEEDSTSLLGEVDGAVAFLLGGSEERGELGEELS